MDWATAGEEAIKGAIQAVEFALAAAVVAWAIDRVRRRRSRRSLLRGVLFELLNNRDYIQMVPGMVAAIANNNPQGQPPVILSWVGGDMKDDAFLRACASDDVRITERTPLFAALRDAYSGVAMIKNSEAEVIRLLDRGDGAQAFRVLTAMANQAQTTIAVIVGALRVLELEGIR